jgi:hypothetical protein
MHRTAVDAVVQFFNRFAVLLLGDRRLPVLVRFCF